MKIRAIIHCTTPKSYCGQIVLFIDTATGKRIEFFTNSTVGNISRLYLVMGLDVNEIFYVERVVGERAFEKARKGLPNASADTSQMAKYIWDFMNPLTIAEERKQIESDHIAAEREEFERNEFNAEQENERKKRGEQ